MRVRPLGHARLHPCSPTDLPPQVPSRPPPTRGRWAAGGLALSLLLAGCWREERAYRPAPESAEAIRWTRQVDLIPGLERPEDPAAVIRPVAGVANHYEENAFALSEGKRLFLAFNCVGCHANGGGGMGPP